MNEVARWMNAGAEVREGLRLLSVYAPNPHLERLVTLAPARFGHLLSRTLSRFSDVRIEAPVPERSYAPGKFRENWPFLADPKCPMELKVLAADKITAYRNYCSLHEKLFDCTDPEECFETAKNLLENYRQNRRIFSEFTYYREHGRILGKHPIFEESAKLRRYKTMSGYQLSREQRRLEGAVWRIRSEMSKGDKPHLREEREERLKRKMRELEAVNTMIDELERNK